MEFQLSTSRYGLRPQDDARRWPWRPNDILSCSPRRPGKTGQDATVDQPLRDIDEMHSHLTPTIDGKNAFHATCVALKESPMTL